jgi:hypothetical protein
VTALTPNRGLAFKLAVVAMLLPLAAEAHAAARSPPCIAQPMPRALDSVPAGPAAGRVIAFAATPWEHPGRAWVLRGSRNGRGGGASLEIMRLLRQNACNHYDVEQRWNVTLSAAEFDALAAAIAPLGTPPAAAFGPGSQFPDDNEIVLDGTGIELRLQAGDWEARRTSNHYARTGGVISALFRDLLAKHIPAKEMPANDWRTRRK